MYLKEVGQNAALRQTFLQFPVQLYAQDENWIRPWDHDIENTFDPQKNKLLAHGECIRWVLFNQAHECIGRVAAFIDFDAAQKDEQATGGMGFFECIDNQEAAFMLFEACRNWLATKGMEAMDGPINFGSRESFWGLMVKGWEFEPTYKMPWTKAYYIKFFDDYGFQDYFQQNVYVASVTYPPIAQSVQDKANRIFQNPEFVFKHIELGKIEKYGRDFMQVFNEAWAKFPGVQPMTEAQALALVKSMKPVIDEELIWFAYTAHDLRPVAFFITIPDLNQIVKHLNGQFDIWAKIKFMLLKWRGVMTRTCGLIFGVVPDYQGKGMESAIALRLRDAGRENPYFQYTSIDMNWVGDFNPKMIRFVSQLGGVVDKKYITYRYLFDRTKPFKRHPRLG